MFRPAAIKHLLAQLVATNILISHSRTITRPSLFTSTKITTTVYRCATDVFERFRHVNVAESDPSSGDILVEDQEYPDWLREKLKVFHDTTLFQTKGVSPLFVK